MASQDRMRLWESSAHNPKFNSDRNEFEKSEKAVAPHSSTFAWKISWSEEPSRLQSMGSLRVGHDWSDLAAAASAIAASRFKKEKRGGGVEDVKKKKNKQANKIIYKHQTVIPNTGLPSFVKQDGRLWDIEVSFQFLNLDTRDDEPPAPKAFMLMWEFSHFGNIPPLTQRVWASATH